MARIFAIVGFTCFDMNSTIFGSSLPALICSKSRGFSSGLGILYFVPCGSLPWQVLQPNGAESLGANFWKTGFITGMTFVFMNLIFSSCVSLSNSVPPAALPAPDPIAADEPVPEPIDEPAPDPIDEPAPEPMSAASATTAGASATAEGVGVGVTAEPAPLLAGLFVWHAVISARTTAKTNLVMRLAS